jgi:outer membrane cobalamin receptor
MVCLSYLNRVGVLLLITWVGFLPSVTTAKEALPLDAPAEAASNTGEAEVPLLREVITTATRSKRKTSQVPAAVSVISREEINAAPANNVDDLLRSLTGIDVKRFAGMTSGLPSRLSIRGIPGWDQTLLMMDGIPVNGVGNGFTSTNSVPLGITDRVEVVRGPFSSLYGSNAFGGVVNVLTRDPTKKASGSLSGELGNDQYRESSVFFSDTVGPMGLYLHADTRSTGNFYSRDHLIYRYWDYSSKSFQVMDLPANHYVYHEERVFGKAVIKVSPSTRITLHGQSFRDILGFGQTVDWPPPVINLPTPQDVSIEDRSTLGAVHVESVFSDKLEITAGGYGCRHFDHILNENPWGNDPVTHDSIYQYTFVDTLFWDWQCELRAVYRPHPDHVLTFGGDTLLNEGRFDPARLTTDGSALPGAVRTRHDLHDTGAYLQEEWADGKWVVVPGVRFDHNSATDWTTSPKLGILFNVTDRFRLRSSAGLAFRAPTLAELYSPDTTESGIILKSNSFLKPQHLDAYDFGFEKDLRENLTLGAEVFTNYMRDLINLESSGISRTYVNIDRAHSSGFDSTLVWKTRGDWKVSLNHTYQWAIDSETKTQLDYMPQNKGNITMVYSHLVGRWRFEGNLQEFISGTRFYTDDQTSLRYLLPGYASTNLGVKVSWRENAYVEMKITNLFNASYEETGNYLAPGRMIQVGSGISF